MGFWSSLGKIGAGIAAPFTGGASLAAIPAIDALGQVTSGAAKGAAGQRLAEGQQGLSYAQLQQQAARDKYQSDLAGSNAQFGAGMQGAQFAREGQDRQKKSAMLKALLGNIQDVNISGMNPKIAGRMPTITGGLRPSAITGGGQREALMALLGQPETEAPGYLAPSPYVQHALPSAPQAGVGENLLGGIGLGANILGAFRKPKAGEVV